MYANTCNNMYVNKKVKELLLLLMEIYLWHSGLLAYSAIHHMNEWYQIYLKLS